MRPTSILKMTPANDLKNDPCAAQACDRSDLLKWSARGGPMPQRLAAHIDRCPNCAQHVRRTNRVFASLKLLQTQPAPVRLSTRANNRALRMLRRAARASAAATRLLRMRPNLTPWQRAQIHVARASLAAAAALLLVAARAGLFTGLERTRDLTRQLASLHWDRHIDPDNEWLDPPNLA